MTPPAAAAAAAVAVVPSGAGTMAAAGVSSGGKICRCFAQFGSCPEGDGCRFLHQRRRRENYNGNGSSGGGGGGTVSPPTTTTTCRYEEEKKSLSDDEDGGSGGSNSGGSSVFDLLEELRAANDDTARKIDDQNAVLADLQRENEKLLREVKRTQGSLLARIAAKLKADEASRADRARSEAARQISSLRQVASLRQILESERERHRQQLGGMERELAAAREDLENLRAECYREESEQVKADLIKTVFGGDEYLVTEEQGRLDQQGQRSSFPAGGYWIESDTAPPAPVPVPPTLGRPSIMEVSSTVDSDEQQEQRSSSSAGGSWIQPDAATTAPAPAPPAPGLLFLPKLSSTVDSDEEQEQRLSSSAGGSSIEPETAPPTPPGFVSSLTVSSKLDGGCGGGSSRCRSDETARETTTAQKQAAALSPTYAYQDRSLRKFEKDETNETDRKKLARIDDLGEGDELVLYERGDGFIYFEVLGRIDGEQMGLAGILKRRKLEEMLREYSSPVEMYEGVTGEPAPVALKAADRRRIAFQEKWYFLADEKEEESTFDKPDTCGLEEDGDVFKDSESPEVNIDQEERSDQRQPNNERKDIGSRPLAAVAWNQTRDITPDRKLSSGDATLARDDVPDSSAAATAAPEIGLDAKKKDQRCRSKSNRKLSSGNATLTRDDVPDSSAATAVPEIGLDANKKGQRCRSKPDADHTGQPEVHPGNKKDDFVPTATNSSDNQKERPVVSLSQPRREAVRLTNTRLSEYLYPTRESSSVQDIERRISPIFDLLQDPDRLETARQLLQYESDMARLKKELKYDEKDMANGLAALEAEKRLFTRYAKKHAALKKEAHNIQDRSGVFDFVKGWFKIDDGDGDRDEGGHDNVFAIEGDILRAIKARQTARKGREMDRGRKAARLKQIKEEGKLLDSKQRQCFDRVTAGKANLPKLEKPVEAKKQEVEALRSRISELTGEDHVEDGDFHIDGSRDSYGHTFLMVAAQNNDLITARLCFRLGADPNVTSSEGCTAMLFAYFFMFQEMEAFIAKNGGLYPKQETEIWKNVTSNSKVAIRNPVNWDSTLQIAEKAAIPPDKIVTKESARALEDSADHRMAFLTGEERKRNFVFFDDSLDQPFDSTSMRRVVLLSESVYSWYLKSKPSSKQSFRLFLDLLKPNHLRKQASSRNVNCHRRSVIGLKRPYEVLCAPLQQGDLNRVVLFTPFVSGYIDGVADVGILAWAVTTDDEASLYKTLIDRSEFNRHKVDDNDHFPRHRLDVLELGKDVHLLDLQATSIFTCKPLDLYIIDVDAGDVESLDNDSFYPKKRVAHHEQQLNRAIFETTEEEARENEAILSGGNAGFSTSLFGGAGTGKTLLMTKKILSVPVERKVLVVTRLPRLVSVIKGAVEQERDARNVTFLTYEDLLSLLSKSVEPTNPPDRRAFSFFTKVQYGSRTESGIASSISFLDDFVGAFLGAKERRQMSELQLGPMTLWTAFRTIKSNARCSLTKQPLCREDYMSLPTSFGLRKEQRSVVYALYLRYEEWLAEGSFKWDEADRVLYVLRWGPTVFSEKVFVSWEVRAFRRGQTELLDKDGESPLYPFFFDLIMVDEAQDFSELDLSLLLRMSSGIRSLFICSDPAQSVELGIRMKAGTINDVFHSSLSGRKGGAQVKNVLQELCMRTNHRTHAQNLAIASAVRSILARSFGLPLTRENALMNGSLPEGLSLKNIRDLGDKRVLSGGNIVFLVPDEVTDQMKIDLQKAGVRNDVFGVREAKGLEFNSVALLGFFSYIDQRGMTREWENVLRWLSSTTGITTVDSSERVQGRQLSNCDYSLSHPEILDQAMLLYTALTRARNRLYIIEVQELSQKRRGNGVRLEDFAMRRFKDLGLIKAVTSIKDGFVEMTPQEHKARGVLLVTQAIGLSRSSANSDSVVRDKFLEAVERFRPDKGNDKELLDQCQKHMESMLLKRSLIRTAKKFVGPAGTYALQGRFTDVLNFWQRCGEYFDMCVGDSFLAEEIREIRALVEDIFTGTPYEARFSNICRAIRQHEAL